MSNKKESIKNSSGPIPQNAMKNEDDMQNDYQLPCVSASTSSTENVTEIKSIIDETENDSGSKQRTEGTSRKEFPEEPSSDTLKEDVVAPAAIGVVERNIEIEEIHNGNDNDNGIRDADNCILPENPVQSSNESQISHFDTVSSVTKDSALVSNMTPFSYYDDDDDDDDVSSMTESFNPELAAQSYKILQLSRSNASGKNGVTVLKRCDKGKRMALLQKISYRDLQLVQEGSSTDEESNSKSTSLQNDEIDNGDNDEPIVLILQRGKQSSSMSRQASSSRVVNNVDQEIQGSDSLKQQYKSKYAIEVPEGMMDGMKSGKRQSRRNEEFDRLISNDLVLPLSDERGDTNLAHLPTVKEEESVMLLEEEVQDNNIDNTNLNKSDTSDDSVVIIILDDDKNRVANENEDQEISNMIEELNQDEHTVSSCASSLSSGVGRTPTKKDKDGQSAHDSVLDESLVTHPLLTNSDSSLSTHSPNESNHDNKNKHRDKRKENNQDSKRTHQAILDIIFRKRNATFIALFLVLICTLLGLFLPGIHEDSNTSMENAPFAPHHISTSLQIYPLMRGNVSFSDVGKLSSINQNGTRVALTGVSIAARSNVKGNVLVMERSNDVEWKTYIVPTAKRHGVQLEFGDMDAVTCVVLSANGNRLAVSSSFYSFEHEKVISYVQVYSFHDNKWSLLGSPLSGIQNDGDSLSLALSYEGDIIAVGASKQSSGIKGRNVGMVCAYHFKADKWQRVGNECLTGSSPGDEMGKSVSLDATGSILAVGTWLSNEKSGHVEIYSYDNDAWSQIGDNILGVQPGDKSGISTALSSDGSRVIIGASHYDGEPGTTNNGQCSIYEYSQENATWNKLGSSITGSSAGDMLGRVVSISANGKLISIGSSIASKNPNETSITSTAQTARNYNGLIRFYDFDGIDWAERKNSTFWGSTGDYCGESLSLADDGQSVVIGCPGDGGASNPFGSSYFVQI